MQNEWVGENIWGCVFCSHVWGGWVGGLVVWGVDDIYKHDSRFGIYTVGLLFIQQILI